MPPKKPDNVVPGALRPDSPFAKQLAKEIHSLHRQDFAEIYIEEGNGFTAKAPKSQPLTPPDPRAAGIRRRFQEMRHLYSNVKLSGRIYDRVQAASFVRQAKFMADYEDNFEEVVPFSMYYPDYQMMSYEQLRTYFTWRSDIRRGIVKQISLSYLFIYIYELINHIGVTDSRDGLQKLIYLWENYRNYEPKLDKYLTSWVKDYYITSQFHESFAELIEQWEFLRQFYPNAGKNDFYQLCIPFSEYKVEKSIFYSETNGKQIQDCFSYVAEALVGYLQQCGTDFDDLVFYSNKGNAWEPFAKALYYNRTDSLPKKRTVKLSYTEVYWYDSGRWVSSLNRVCKENGRMIIGYLLRRIEQFLRKATKFKYQLNANREKINSAEIRALGIDCDSFFTYIDTAIMEFYRLSQRKTITVDLENLERIRASALATQEKLLVTEEESNPAWQEETPLNVVACGEPPELPKGAGLSEDLPKQPSILPETAVHPMEGTETDVWTSFARALTETETKAMKCILQDAGIQELHRFSKEHHTMAEVLIDGINEKAIDTVKDNVLELSDIVEVYEEYRSDLERVIFHESE